MPPENGKRPWQGAPHSVGNNRAAEATAPSLATQAEIAGAPSRSSYQRATAGYDAAHEHELADTIMRAIA